VFLRRLDFLNHLSDAPFHRDEFYDVDSKEKVSRAKLPKARAQNRVESAKASTPARTPVPTKLPQPAQQMGSTAAVKLDTKDHSAKPNSSLSKFFASYRGFNYDPSLTPVVSFQQLLEQKMRDQCDKAGLGRLLAGYHAAMKEDAESWLGPDALTTMKWFCQQE
jgi:hypothetical protein